MEEIVICIEPEITISVVSHAQGNLVDRLLKDLNRCCHALSIEVVLTLNVAEDLPFTARDFSFPLTVICNDTPLGFATNHNKALFQASGNFLCVINPDIQLGMDPLPKLCACLEESLVGVVAPLVVNDHGDNEDNARFFPTPLKIVHKAFGGRKALDYVVGEELIHPDWVGGMFMLFRREIFISELQGFNQRFFLYYEDVDLCARLCLLGYKTVLCPHVKVVHNARRTSHRQLRYFRWHLVSMLRFFCSRVFWMVMLKGKKT